jgi:hypothetical protein
VGDKIGTIKVGPGDSLLTFHENSQFPGKLKIKQNKIGQWAGVMKLKDEEWKIKLACKDR